MVRAPICSSLDILQNVGHFLKSVWPALCILKDGSLYVQIGKGENFQMWIFFPSGGYGGSNVLLFLLYGEQKSKS